MQYDRRAEGDWVELVPGVLRFASASPTFRMRAMAAALWAHPDGVVSHLSAARLWELEGIVGATPVHVTVPPPRRLRHADVVVHRSADLGPADRASTFGIAVTSPVRTVLDLAAVVDESQLELAIEDALRRRLFRIGQLERRAAARRGKGFAGSRVVAGLVGRHGSVVTDSGWELRLARLLASGGLPEPVRQLQVVTVLGPLHVDLAYPGSSRRCVRVRQRPLAQRRAASPRGHGAPERVARRGMRRRGGDGRTHGRSPSTPRHRERGNRRRVISMFPVIGEEPT
jgi:hypothetical protein